MEFLNEVFGNASNKEDSHNRNQDDSNNIGQEPETSQIPVKRDCSICLSSFTPYEGYICYNDILVCGSCDYFTCWVCMLETYKSSAQENANSNLFNRDGQLLCFNKECKQAVTLESLYYCSSPLEIMLAQQSLHLKIQKEQAIQAALAQQKAQIHAEYMRIEQIKDQDEKTAAKLHQRIVEEVLTLKCPRCAQAFQDFDGCFALTCGNKHCSAGFCAWCLTDCGSDAHAHVPSCPEHPSGSPHGSEEEFLAHHRVRRVKRTKEMITAAELNERSSEILCDMLVADLRDIEIPESDIFPAMMHTDTDISTHLPEDPVAAAAIEATIEADEVAAALLAAELAETSLEFDSEDYVENWED